MNRKDWDIKVVVWLVTLERPSGSGCWRAKGWSTLGRAYANQQALS